MKKAAKSMVFILAFAMIFSAFAGAVGYDQANAAQKNDNQAMKGKAQTQSEIDFNTPSKTLANGEFLVEWYETEELYSFVYDGTSVMYALVEVTGDWDADDKAYFDETPEITLALNENGLSDAEDYYEEWDSIVESVTLEDGYYGWIVMGPKDLKKGYSYSFIVENQSLDYDFYVDYSIETYNGYSKSISIANTLSVEVESEKQISVSKHVPSNSYADIQWKSSNTSIAKVDSLGYVYGKKAGTCTVTATLDNGNTYSCSVTVKNPKPYIKYNKYTTYRGGKFTNKIMYATGPVKWWSTNKKVATVSKNGKVTPKKLGTCYIKAKSGGKTYKCKVVVTYLDPNFYSELISYNTRSNTFKIKIKNKGKKTLTIYSKDAYSQDKDYKSYDRKLKLTKGYSKVTIKPGKSKNVYFKVKGRTTWPDVYDHTVFYKFKYDGKTYRARAWAGSCGDYKDGKGWYYTMWDYEY